METGKHATMPTAMFPVLNLNRSSVIRDMCRSVPVPLFLASVPSALTPQSASSTNTPFTEKNLGQSTDIGRGKSLLPYSAAVYSRHTNSIRPLPPSSFILYLHIYPFICQPSSRHPSTPHLMTLPWVQLQLGTPVHPSYISLAHRHLHSRTH